MEAHKFDPITGEDELALRRRAGAGCRHAGADRNPNDPSTWGKVGRNEDCPCGSGKKFKHCHGRTRKPRVTRTEIGRTSPAISHIMTKMPVEQTGA